MKFLAILVISVISFVQAEGGHYVPKSVYFIDENGNPSDPRPVNPGLLERVRRQVNPQFGGFAFPQPVFNFPQVKPGQGGQSSFTQTSQSLSSRFGDEPVVTGQQTTFTSSGGKFQQTNTVLRPDGSVQTNQQTGRVKRDTNTQLQSQGNEKGNVQTQRQSNDAPAANQFQSQSQPGLTQTQSQGSNPVPQPQGSNPVPQPQGSNLVQQPQGSDQLPVNAEPLERAQNNGQRPPQNQPQNRPQNQPQNHPQNHQQGQQNYPQGQPGYPVQPGFGFGAPFGFGGFGGNPGFGFPQQGFGFPAFGFGFPTQGFGFPNFGFAPGFGAPGFGGPVPQQGPQPGFAAGGQNLDNRFGEDEVPTVVGSTQTITSQNGVFHATSSILKPNGQVETTHHSGKFPKKN